MAEMSFDPRRHVRRVHLQGQTVDYLDVKWRLVWLRTEQPEAQVTTEHVQITPERAVFRATVTIPGGGSATGYGTGADVEAAESAALGRALLALGFGTAYAADHVLAAELASPATPPLAAPVGRAQPPPSPAPAPAPAAAGDLPSGVTVGPGGGRALPPKLAAIFAQAQPIVDVVSEEPAGPVESTEAALGVTAPPVADATPPAPRPSAVRERPPAPAEPPAAPVRAEGRAGPPPPAMPSVQRGEPPARDLPPSLGARGGERARPAAGPTARSVLGRSAASAADDATEDDGAGDDEGSQADNDWSAFWPWARSRGYFNRDDIEKAIGQPLRNRTPREIRTLILNLDDA
ncbi:MAG: hypothetical protein IT340_19025 [Chloroflexi bacterium]|nr:hypothetical protein [Chloroflexota bacterium]